MLGTVLELPEGPVEELLDGLVDSEGCALARVFHEGR
ncbi:hypothetical protein AARI_02760 [Glutamicibacter arilaitensis Re117]|uniref:Uncharacterized protein n=1 Tax=Glutamicibacter arilaitensis (strain DSM 16368 / CIP 108037 / IAM 15318 / JCM 13566 / NCIMB 14258 / Re117) TaxID=861360 RepID=A0ABM9PTF4_GLUAR|nr:hypothetical protein AARI_02760 [Glutamicibacter arilaitensis Re117]